MKQFIVRKREKIEKITDLFFLKKGASAPD